MKFLLSLSIIMTVSFTAAAQKIPAWKITELQAYMQQSNTPVIVSFWATYCIPCLKEVPYFEEAITKYKKDSVRILLVSLDMKEQYPHDITAMVQKRKFASPVVWLNETDADYFCPKVDSAWSGALPSTLFINNKNGYRKFFEEEIPKEKIDTEIKAMLKGQK